MYISILGADKVFALLPPPSHAYPDSYYGICPTI